MKKKLLILIMLVFTLTTNAQFKATSKGVATKDGKDFYVVEVEKKTAPEMYKSAMAYIISNFKNPNVVANKQENEMINLHGVYAGAVFAKKKIFDIYADVDVSIVMYFKDGRIRFDIPIINSMYYNDDYELTFSNGVSILDVGDIDMFYVDGRPRNEEAIISFEKFINSVINEIVGYIQGNKNNDW